MGIRPARGSREEEPDNHGHHPGWRLPHRQDIAFGRSAHRQRIPGTTGSLQRRRMPRITAAVPIPQVQAERAGRPMEVLAQEKPDGILPSGRPRHPRDERRNRGDRGDDAPGTRRRPTVRRPTSSVAQQLALDRPRPVRRTATKTARGFLDRFEARTVRPSFFPVCTTSAHDAAGRSPGPAHSPDRREGRAQQGQDAHRRIGGTGTRLPLRPVHSDRVDGPASSSSPAESCPTVAAGPDGTIAGFVEMPPVA